MLPVRILRNLRIDIKDRLELRHLIEDQFEHRNTNRFKLSVCLFLFGKIIQGSQSTI